MACQLTFDDSTISGSITTSYEAKQEHGLYNMRHRSIDGLSWEGLGRDPRQAISGVCLLVVVGVQEIQEKISRFHDQFTL
jgi:hypothetical protein